jgi:hypothetical protein
MTYELTLDAVELGLQATLPAVLEIVGQVGEFGRGERVRASKTHVSAHPRTRPPLLLENVTGPPKVWPDEYRKTG